jgi:hypothetical protein
MHLFRSRSSTLANATRGAVNHVPKSLPAYLRHGDANVNDVTATDVDVFHLSFPKCDVGGQSEPRG